MLTLQDIRDAATRLQGQVLDTPCVESKTLSQIVGAQVFLKFENLQFTASFKERGALNKLLQLGLHDGFRLHNDAAGVFSWWDYRGDGYGRNLGLRIDHLLCSARAADTLHASEIDEVPRQQEKPSDHAPVIGTFQLP